MENVVNKLSYDESALLNEGFDGDAERLETAWAEFEQLCSERGVNVPNRDPGAVWVSSSPRAFEELRGLFEEATSERPDDDLDLLLAYLAGAQAQVVHES